MFKQFIINNDLKFRILAILFFCGVAFIYHYLDMYGFAYKVYLALIMFVLIHLAGSYTHDKMTALPKLQKAMWYGFHIIILIILGYGFYQVVSVLGIEFSIMMEIL